MDQAERDYTAVIETYLGWRLGVFLVLLLTMLAAERLRPRRREATQWRVRWPSNFGLVIVSSVLMLAIPVSAIAAAMLAQDRSWGLLNQIGAPAAVNLMVGMVLLDLAIYWQHRAMHVWRWLWPLHRVHHTDTVLDASSGLRFHPAEILLSMLWKSLVVLAIGAQPLTVLVYEIALNACSLFNHANWHLPRAADRVLRWVLVTPDMHRVHHSVRADETNSNFGNGASVWDRLFGTYVARPRAGNRHMRIGLEHWRDVAAQRLDRLLLQPWAGGRDS